MMKDPVAAARRLGPYTVATHTKDVDACRHMRPEERCFFSSVPVGTGLFDMTRPRRRSDGRVRDVLEDIGEDDAVLLWLRPRAASRCDRRAMGCANAEHARGMHESLLGRSEYTSVLLFSQSQRGWKQPFNVGRWAFVVRRSTAGMLGG
ncbi:MAG: hypothetical protein FJ276_10160 [Planctomycetes bacterium]|nr:hypothetical protein [Planctomycetota bacterium]